SLVEAYHAFRRLDLGDASAVDRDRLFDACGTWRRVLAASSIDMQLEREALYGPPLPRAARPADGGGIAFRPWDIELMALEDGLRHLVKLDRVPPAAAELREIAAQRGLCVEAVTPEDGGED